MDDHSSGTSVAGRLARPTRAALAKTQLAGTDPLRNRPAGRPYAVLLPVGFAVPPPLPAARCALTAPFHPCRQSGPCGPWGRRFAFCGTFPGVAPAGHYPAPCFRGARTFLDPAVASEAAVIQPSGKLRGRDAGPRSQRAAGPASRHRPRFVIPSFHHPRACLGDPRRMLTRVQCKKSREWPSQARP